jgi:hypothetical protein
MISCLQMHMTANICNPFIQASTPLRPNAKTLFCDNSLVNWQYCDSSQGLDFLPMLLIANVKNYTQIQIGKLRYCVVRSQTICSDALQSIHMVL